MDAVRSLIQQVNRRVARKHQRGEANARREEAKNLQALAQLMAREESAAEKAEVKRQKAQAKI